MTDPVTLEIKVTLTVQDGPVTSKHVVASVAQAVDDYQMNHGLSKASDQGYISGVDAELLGRVQPELTVWEGAMPESNGKSNFTAILRRKGGRPLDALTDGITLARSEYPDRVRYEADRARYLLGERVTPPFILDYDADKHSGYVHPDRFEDMAKSKGYDVTKTECGQYLYEKTQDLRAGWDAARSTW